MNNWLKVSTRRFGARVRRTALTLGSVALALLAVPVGSAAQQTGSLTGLVTDARTGQPLDAAQVFVVGTEIGSLSGGNGRYLILNVRAGTQQIRTILLGYQTVTQVVTVQVGQPTLADFALESRAIDLDEIIVTGTAGAARRREIGNSIASISAVDLEERVVVNMDDALSAANAGLDIHYSSGTPGDGAQIRIRGVNSISQGNEPLIYVDGVRIYNKTYMMSKSGPFAALTSMGSPSQTSSAINDIAPGDIERIEVIKGAAATTLYGTEGAGGVIQIFTKSGLGMRQDTTIWSLQITQGYAHHPTRWPGGDVEPSAAWFERFGPESEGMWVKQWTEPGYLQTYNLSATGKRSDVGYYVSGHWQRDKGTLPNLGSSEFAVRGNTSFTTSNLVVQFNNALTRRKVDWISGGSEAEGFLLQVIRGPNDYTNDQDERALEDDYDDFQTHWTSGLNVAYVPTTALEMQATVGFDLVDQDMTSVYPFGSWFVPTGERSNRRFQTETRTLDFRTTYRADIGGISTTTSVGFASFQNEIKEVHGLVTRFAGPHESTLTSGAVRNVVENRLRSVNAGFFVQEILGFADKFFLTAGLRVDGNSSFGEDFGLQTYPKVSGSYIISDEDWWPDFFDAMKLRAAYGQSGKAPGFFDASRVWSPVQAKEGAAGVTPGNLGNPELGPERSREIEAGVEASVMDGRLGLDFTYYDQRTLDALIPVQQDPSLGFAGSQLLNVGTLANWGTELSLNVQPVWTRNLQWDLGFTYSRNKSEVKDLGGAPPISLGSRGHLWMREGFPIGAWFGEKVTNPNEFADPVLAVDPDPLFGNKVFLGPSSPTTTWTIHTSLQIGDRLRISSRGAYMGGHRIFSRTAERNTQQHTWPPCFDAQEKVAAGDLSQVTAFDRFNCALRVRKGPVTGDASFFRLRDVTVSYEVPERWIPGVSSLTVTFGATNLFLITDYIGLDPEVYSVGGELRGGFSREEEYVVPPLQRFNLTLRTTF